MPVEWQDHAREGHGLERLEGVRECDRSSELNLQGTRWAVEWKGAPRSRAVTHPPSGPETSGVKERKQPSVHLG